MGCNKARFQWKVDGANVLGTVVGLTQVGTHHKPVSPSQTEAGLAPGHWELNLLGTIMDGAKAGARLRANLVLEMKSGLGAGEGVEGTFEGLIEEDLQLTEGQKIQRLKNAEAEAKTTWDYCDGALPCLNRIAKQGRGEMILDGTATNRNRQKPCGSYKTWSRLVVDVASMGRLDTAAFALPKGTFVMKELVQIFENNKTHGRGEHSGEFEYRTAQGVLMTGTILGINASGTHRSPLSHNYEAFDEKNHLEGRLQGTLLKGALAGSNVEARYVIKIISIKGRRQKVSMTIDGWTVTGCMDKVASPKNSSTDGKDKPKTGMIRRIPDFNVRANQSKSAREFLEKFSREKFSKADVDHNGVLSFQEFSDSRRKNGRIKFDDTPLVKKNILLKDKNKDGQLSAEEDPNLWKKYSSLDSNKDKKLNPEELRPAAQLSDQNDFSKADKNNNNSLDNREFLSWCSSQPTVINKKK